MTVWQIIIQFFILAIRIYLWIYFIYILLSWLPIDPDSPIVRFIRGMCEPLYNWVLKILPPLRIGMLDLSVMYIVIFFSIIRYLLVLLYNRLA